MSISMSIPVYPSLNIDQTTPCTCSNCGLGVPVGDTVGIDDFDSRVSPGEEMPAGECPDCGALCHLVKIAKAVQDELPAYPKYKHRSPDKKWQAKQNKWALSPKGHIYFTGASDQSLGWVRWFSWTGFSWVTCLPDLHFDRDCQDMIDIRILMKQHDQPFSSR